MQECDFMKVGDTAYIATREEAEKSIEKAPETKRVRGNPYDRWY